MSTQRPMPCTATGSIQPGPDLQLSPSSAVASAVATTREQRQTQATNIALNGYDAACKKAARLLREGRHGRAHHELGQAALAIARAVGDHASTEALDDLIYVAPFAHQPAGPGAQTYLEEQ